MPSSPTITEFNNKLKGRYGIKNFYSIATKSYSYFIVIYPVIVLLALLIIKPKMILKEKHDLLEENNETCEISYDKLIIWYLLLQMPVFVYVFIRMTEKAEK
jgi:hypothetical protein